MEEVKEELLARFQELYTTKGQEWPKLLRGYREWHNSAKGINAWRNLKGGRAGNESTRRILTDMQAILDSESGVHTGISPVAYRKSVENALSGLKTRTAKYHHATKAAKEAATRKAKIKNRNHKQPK